MGRPPIAGVRQSYTLQVRVTSDELEQLKLAAEAMGIGISTWVRDVAVMEARRCNERLYPKTRRRAEK